MNRDVMHQDMPNNQQVVEPPMPPSQPRLPQSVEAPHLPVQEATIEQQIIEAKKLLGVDTLEKELNQAMADNLYKDSMAEVLGKYPELKKSDLENELNKLAEADPQALEFYKSSRSGLDLFAKNLKDTINPKAQPDEITDDSSTTAVGDDGDNETVKRIQKGEASSIEFGEYIGKLLK